MPAPRAAFDRTDAAAGRCRRCHRRHAPHADVRTAHRERRRQAVRRWCRACRAHLQPYVQQQGYPPHPQYPAAVPQMRRRALPAAAVRRSPAPQADVADRSAPAVRSRRDPHQYKVSGDASRWVKLVHRRHARRSRSRRSSRSSSSARAATSTPDTGTIHVESVPPGGEIFVDGTHVAGRHAADDAVPAPSRDAPRDPGRAREAQAARRERRHPEGRRGGNGQRRDGSDHRSVARRAPRRPAPTSSSTAPYVDALLPRSTTSTWLGEEARAPTEGLSACDPNTEWPANGEIDIEKNLTR